MESRPLGLPSVAFQLRHIARSLDRLLTYAEGRQLSPQQREALGTETQDASDRSEVLAEFVMGLEQAMARVTATDPASYGEVRGVGRKEIPTTVGSLLIHCAEHTQRHVGQAITTAKVNLALRGGGDGGA
jgi:uncharacterized damage-inducible protein DinB